MKCKPLDGQLAFDLFKQQKEPKRGNPTWEDVQKGRAHLVDVIEPCDRCAIFWRSGRCTHTADNYAFPKKRPNGMCLKHRIVWNA